MKRCPECDSLFPDTEYFCELDGTPLFAEDDSSKTMLPTPQPHQASSQRFFIVVALGGVVIGVLLFLIYLAMTRETPPENQSVTNANTSVAQQPPPTRPLQLAPLPSVSPSAEPSVSPTPEPSPSPQSSPERIALSSNPISTAAGGKTGPVIIKLNDGVTIEADEAWQTGEGIWYRRHGVVTLLNPNNVKAIENVPAASPQPSSAQRTP